MAGWARRALALGLLAASMMLGCGPRQGAVPPGSGPLTPAPPPPPGSITVWGPLRIDSVDVVRSEVGWERDFVRAQRAVIYDMVLTQERATCPATTPLASSVDLEECRGVTAFAASCSVEPVMRARVEVMVTQAIDVAARCAGDATPFVVPASGDARAALTSAASSCFRARNKFKPEASWTSLYALTELQITEKTASISTAHARLLSRLLDGKTMHCRDDGAYLDGTPGRPIKPSAPKSDDAPMANALAARAPLAGEGDAASTPSTPLTGDAWVSEHDLWERCAGAPKDHVVAQERCQLLRQFDRFVRDVEDLARPETPKGSTTITPGTTPSTGPSTSTSAGSKP